jgi:hypothetical protein
MNARKPLHNGFGHWEGDLMLFSTQRGKFESGRHGLSLADY